MRYVSSWHKESKKRAREKGRWGFWVEGKLYTCADKKEARRNARDYGTVESAIPMVAGPAPRCRSLGDKRRPGRMALLSVSTDGGQTYRKIA